MRIKFGASNQFSGCLLAVCLVVINAAPVVAQPAVRIAELAEAVGQINPRVIEGEFNGDPDYEPRRMLSADIRARRQAINRWDVSRWRNIRAREEWEELRDARTAKL